MRARRLSVSYRAAKGGFRCQCAVPIDLDGAGRFDNGWHLPAQLCEVIGNSLKIIVNRRPESVGHVLQDQLISLAHNQISLIDHTPVQRAACRTLYAVGSNYFRRQERVHRVPYTLRFYP